MNLVRFKGIPILEQLQLEEKLLRTSSENWCIVNDGTNSPTIVMGMSGFGGNAQSITKNRWIHHTSFLWDYETKNMAYLKQPRRIPEYRSERNHLEFICPMKEYMPRSAFIEKTVSSVGSRFLVVPTSLEAIGAHSGTAFTHSTSLLTKQELEAALGSQPLNLPLEFLES
ncbi:hypothetical protein MKX01_027592 [Papaver californicum]|nr:hypothetical protein MKX01_027592 [Papaver californicum]